MKGIQNKRVNLVNWKKVTRPKAPGGLGIRTAREVNTSLIGKSVWVQQNRDKLWVQLLCINTSLLKIFFIKIARQDLLSGVLLTRLGISFIMVINS